MFQRKGEAALGLFRALIIGAFILALPLALITTNIRIAVSERAVYDYAVKHYGAEEASGIPESELLRANRAIRSYLVNDEPGPLSITVTDSRGQAQPLFNPRETAHMADVRDLVQLLFSVQVVSVALVVSLAAAMLALWPPRALAAALLYASVLTVGLLVLSGMVSVSGFDSAWTQFHVIAFNNDFWELDPRTDHLIQMYPEAFWFDVTMLIGMAAIAEAVLLSLVAGGYLIASRPREERRETPAPRPLPLPAIEHRPGIAPPDPQHYVH